MTRPRRPHALQQRVPLWFGVPAAAIFVFIIIVPSIQGIAYSFTDWNTYSEEVNYVGLENFQRIFSPEENYLDYIYNTLVFTGLTVVFKTVIGLGLAILLNEGVRHFVNLYRVIIYLPAVFVANGSETSCLRPTARPPAPTHADVP